MYKNVSNEFAPSPCLCQARCLSLLMQMGTTRGWRWKEHSIVYNVGGGYGVRNVLWLSLSILYLSGFDVAIYPHLRRLPVEAITLVSART